MSSILEIRLDEPCFALYGLSSASAGKALKGTVTVSLKKTTKVKSLFLNFLGETNIHWIYSAALLNTNCRFKNTLINRSLALLEPSPGYHTLSAGEHAFPFELALPGDLIETITTKVVCCRYILTAIAERTHFWNQSIAKKVVLIKRIYPHDDDPIVLSEVIPNFMEVSVFVHRKVYGLGDIIPVNIRSIPFTSQVLMRISCSIKEITTYRKPESSKTNTEDRWFKGIFESGFESASMEKTIYIPIHSNRLNSACSTRFMDTKHEIVMKVEVRLSQCQTENSACHFLRFPVLILSDPYKKIYEDLPAYSPNPPLP